jgi:hypothetical protein
MAFDITEVKELVDRLEWMSLELHGTVDQPGLLDKLSLLLVNDEGAGPPASKGLVPRVEKLCADIDRVLDNQSTLSSVILRPVPEDQRQSILEAVESGFNAGRSHLQEEMEDYNKGSRLAAEQITKATAEAELLFRSQQDSLSAAQDQMNKSSGQVAQQLRQMLGEIKSSISEESLQEPLRAALEKTLASGALEVNQQQLTESWRLVSEDLVKKIRNEMLQNREGIEDLFRETQAEQLKHVKEIIHGRTPSQTIVTLYDDLDATKAQLQVKEKQVRKLTIDIDKLEGTDGKSYMKPYMVTAICSFILGGAGVFILLKVLG